MKNENFVDFSWLINVVTRRKWFIIIPLAVAALISLFILIILPPGYKASTTIMVEPSESSKTSELNVLMAGERMALTYSQIINSRPILQDAITQLDMELTVSQLADMVSVQPIENTQLIQISVTSSDDDKAIAIANAIASSFISYIKKLSIESYNQALTNNQASIDTKQSEIDKIISDTNVQTNLKSDLEAERTKLDLTMSRYKDDYLALQQNIQSLELAISANTNKVRVVEPAYITSANVLPYVASLNVFFAREVITGSTDVTLNISGQIAQIYGPMLTQDYLLNEVIARLSLNETPASLANRITYESLAGTQLLHINVSDNDPSQATLIADTLAQVFVQQVQKNLSISDNQLLVSLRAQMEDLSSQMNTVQEQINANNAQAIPIDLEIERLNNELGAKYLDLRSLQTNYDQLTLEAGQAKNTVVISEPATHAKTIQNKFMYAAILILLAAVGSLGLVFILENFDDRVRSQSDVISVLGSKPIGVISHIARGKDKFVFGDNSSPHVSEDFRKMSAGLRPTLREIPVKTLLVTSPHPGEGKSIIAANLGLVFAKTGTRVIIMDADLHLPRQHVLFDVDIQNGLSDCLLSNLTEPNLRETDTPGLRLLTSGNQPGEPAELLSRPTLENVLDKLSGSAELVIIDCPPIVTLADASYLAPYVDGALLVIRSGVTKRKEALEAATILKNAGIKFVGVVLNDVLETPEGFYQYYDAKAGG